MQISNTNNIFSFSGNFNIKNLKSSSPKLPLAEDVVYYFEKLKNPIAELLTTNKDFLKTIKSELNITNLSPSGFSILFKDRELHLEIKNKNKLILKEENLYTGNIENYVEIQEGKIIEEKHANSKFTRENLELLDFYILKLRKILHNNNPEKTILSHESSVASGVGEKKYIYSIDSLKSTTKEIRELYTTIYDNLAKIKTPTTRSSIKNSFYSIKHTRRGDKSLSFLEQDKENKNFSINVLKRNNVEYTVLNFDNIDLIISENNEFYKSKNINWRYDSGKKSVLYNNDELLTEEIIKNVSTLKDLLFKYNEYIVNRINLKNKKLELNSTSEIGRISHSAEEGITLLKKHFQECRKLLSKNHSKKYRDQLCQFYGMELRGNSPSIIFKYITSQKEDLQLSFPKISAKDSVKILLLDGKNIIKRSFLSFENKLVKFEAKNLSKSKRNDNNFNFYNQTEINNSGFEKYIEILCSGIKRINDSIKAKEYKK